MVIHFHHYSLCYLYHLTLAAICLNNTVIVPLCDCNNTVQLLPHFYRRLLYDCSTMPLQLLRQEYKCCAVRRLTTKVLNFWNFRHVTRRRGEACSEMTKRRICHFPFIELIAMASSSIVKGALEDYILWHIKSK